MKKLSTLIFLLAITSCVSKEIHVHSEGSVTVNQVGSEWEITPTARLK